MISPPRSCPARGLRVPPSDAGEPPGLDERRGQRLVGVKAIEHHPVVAGERAHVVAVRSRGVKVDEALRLEPAQQRLEGQSLEDERAEHRLGGVADCNAERDEWRRAVDEITYSG